jgi:exosome complex component RRP41
MEFVSPEGLRQDGRRPHELRRTAAQLDVLESADGSAIFEMGNTKVKHQDQSSRQQFLAPGSSSNDAPRDVYWTMADLWLQVLAAVFGPREVEVRSQQLADRALIKCEYSMAAFSTGEKPMVEETDGHPATPARAA